MDAGRRRRAQWTRLMFHQHCAAHEVVACGNAGKTLSERKSQRCNVARARV